MNLKFLSMLSSHLHVRM